MVNWLEKIIPPAPSARGRNLPANVRPGRPPAPMAQAPHGQLPNASLIYGLAASALFAIALVFLLRGHWFTALLVLLPAAGFLGFALHFVKHHK